MKGICFKPHLHELTTKRVKTQTRRIIKIEDCSDRHKALKGRADWWDEPMKLKKSPLGDYWNCELCGHPISLENLNGLKPRYNVGEVLYLKEPYRFAPDVDFIIYKFDYPSGRYEYPGCDVDATPVKWENKLFMPAKYARTFIKITAVRAELLQDISDEDCIREGILKFTKDDTVFKYGVNGWKWDEMPRTPKEAYQALINQINGSSTWNDNPFVWVYDYELVQPHSPL